MCNFSSKFTTNCSLFYSTILISYFLFHLSLFQLHQDSSLIFKNSRTKIESLKSVGCALMASSFIGDYFYCIFVNSILYIWHIYIHGIFIYMVYLHHNFIQIHHCIGHNYQCCSSGIILIHTIHSYQFTGFI